MKTVTEFNTSVAVVTKMITSSYNGAFHLAILAFGKLLVVFH